MFIYVYSDSIDTSSPLRSNNISPSSHPSFHIPPTTHPSPTFNFITNSIKYINSTQTFTPLSPHSGPLLPPPFLTSPQWPSNSLCHHPFPLPSSPPSPRPHLRSWDKKIYQHFTLMCKEVEFFSKKTSFNSGQLATSWAENLPRYAREVFSPRSGLLPLVEGGFFC